MELAEVRGVELGEEGLDGGGDEGVGRQAELSQVRGVESLDDGVGDVLELASVCVAGEEAEQSSED